MSTTNFDIESDEELRSRRDRLAAELDQLSERGERSGVTDGMSTRFDELVRGIEKIDQELSYRAGQRSALAEREAVARAAVAAGQYETGFHAPDVHVRSGRKPHDRLDGLSFRTMTDTDVRSRALDSIEQAPEELPTRSREILSALAERPRTGRDAAEFILASSNPHYRSAFEKVLRDPQHGHRLWSPEELAAYQAVTSSRAAMSLTSANGGYLVPQLLDPSVILTNSGSSNPFRAISRVETGTSDQYDAVVSAGVTSEWLAEGSEAADATPTFTSAPIVAHKAAAYVFGSYEVLGDTNIGEQLPRILQDSKDNIEAAAFVAGSGSGAPYGVVTRVAAVTASRVDPTTAGDFGTAADVYAVDEALTDRARQSRRAAWVANRAIVNDVRQFDTSGGSSFWANLGEGVPEQLLGRPIYESSEMDSAVTTGSNVLLAGDFEQYLIYDRLGMTLVYDPVVLGSNRRPTGQGAWFAYWRVGADVTNVDAFRVLQL